MWTVIYPHWHCETSDRLKFAIPMVEAFSPPRLSHNRQRITTHTPTPWNSKLASATTTPCSDATDCDTYEAPPLLRTLYPPLKPYQNGTLGVDSIHTLYYEQYGSPHGIPALVLHGGPGAGCFPRHAQFFDPTKYRIVLLDQRGAGKSTPRGRNTKQHLVSPSGRL